MSSSKRLAILRTCPECLVEFHPLREQECCSPRCAAFRRTRMHREMYQAAMAHARAVRRARVLERMGVRLTAMKTKGEIWRAAYRRGYLTGYARAVDRKPAQFRDQTQGTA